MIIKCAFALAPGAFVYIYAHCAMCVCHPFYGRLAGHLAHRSEIWVSCGVRRSVLCTPFTPQQLNAGVPNEPECVCVVCQRLQTRHSNATTQPLEPPAHFHYSLTKFSCYCPPEIEICWPVKKCSSEVAVELRAVCIIALRLAHCDGYVLECMHERAYD